MDIIGCQWNLAWEDRTANYARVRELLEGVSGTDLIVLPEMFPSGFSSAVDLIAEPDPSPTEAFLQELAQRNGVTALGGLVRRLEDGWGSNELIAFDKDAGELGRYRKNRTFRYTGESDHFRAGSELLLFQMGEWTVAPFICYDLRFPELFRRAVARGAELLIVIASWPVARVDHWVTLLQARAIENQAYVIGVNRTGQDPQYSYPGRSLVIDPWGRIVADAGAEEGLLRATLDHAALRQWRAEFPALADLEA